MIFYLLLQQRLKAKMSRNDWQNRRWKRRKQRKLQKMLVRLFSLANNEWISVDYEVLWCLLKVIVWVFKSVGIWWENVDAANIQTDLQIIMSETEGTFYNFSSIGGGFGGPCEACRRGHRGSSDYAAESCRGHQKAYTVIEKGYGGHLRREFLIVLPCTGFDCWKREVNNNNKEDF